MTNNFRTNVSRTKHPNTIVSIRQIFLEQMILEKWHSKTNNFRANVSRTNNPDTNFRVGQAVLGQMPVELNK